MGGPIEAFRHSISKVEVLGHITSPLVLQLAFSSSSSLSSCIETYSYIYFPQLEKFENTFD